MARLTDYEASRVQKLEALINKHNDHYYNTGKSLISDEKYDRYKDELREYVPNHKLLKQVGTKVRAGRNKVTLPYPMGSLDKIKLNGVDAESVAAFASKYPGPYVVSNKLDGISLEVIYEGGVPVAGYKRGETTVGEDVTPLLPYLKIPQKIRFRRHIAIRFECVIKDAVFEKYMADEFKNARNTAGGIMNKIKSIHKHIGRMDTVALGILSPRVSPSAAFKFLKEQGFAVAPYTVVQNITDASLHRILENRRSKSHYAIDGVVVEQDKKSALRVGNPLNARAYKIPSDIAEVEVTKIEWRPSKHKYLIPRVHVKPVKLSGVTVEHATGFNAKYIKVNKIGPGAIIGVMRSGEVIPDIQYVKKPAAVAQMPDPKVFGAMTWTPSKVHLIAQHSALSDAKAIAHFFTTIKAEGVKLATIQKFIDAGLDDIFKICKATPARFMKVPGVQQRSAVNFHENIKSALAKVTLARLMDASGCFGRGLGEKRLAPLIKKYPNLMTKKYSSAKLAEMARSITGFDKLATQFADNFKEFSSFYTKLGVVPKVVVLKVTGAKLKGKGVCFTGVRDLALQDVIVSQGGSIQSGVTKNTQILVAKDISGSTDKLNKARALGIEVLTLDQFKRKYKL